MKRPNSIPENIWQAAELISKVLQRKRDNRLAIMNNERFSITESNTTTLGGYNEKQFCNQAAGRTSTPNNG